MKLFKARKCLSTIAGMALAMGIASHASAAPVFTIDPSVIPGNFFANVPFNATFISGISSELLTLDPLTNTASGSGWAQFNGFSNFPTPVNPLTAGLNIDYQLYLQFTLADILTSGTFGQAGSEYALTTLDFSMYADPGLDTTFTAADASGSGTAASVGGTTSDDILLAYGNLISGVAGFNTLGGAYLNSIQTFAICSGSGTATAGVNTVAAANCVDATGRGYFAAPVPFYELAFDEFNNTSQGLERNGNLIAITNATGGVDFNRVPEPATLGLLGVGLLGLAMGRRRRKD